MFKILNYFSKGVGIDLGTANLRIYLAGRGIVASEPSIAAINNKTNQILALGEEAKKMFCRTPAHVTVVYPLVNGVVSDFEIAQEILRHYLKKIGGSTLFFKYNRAVVSIPSNLTEVERKSVEDAVIEAGVSKAYLIEGPLAAAIGARLPIDDPSANVIVDIGGGTTEIAVISTGGIVTAKSLKIAGNKFNEDIIRFVKDEFRLAIGEPTAEELKINIGSATPLNDQKAEMTIRGRDLTTGLPREIIVKNSQVRAAISKSLKGIIEAIKEVVEITPPELTGDILRRGIYLCGGGSLMRGMDQLVARELMTFTNVIDDPLTCVVRGAGIVVENLSKYAQILNSPLVPKDIKA